VTAAKKATSARSSSDGYRVVGSRIQVVMGEQVLQFANGDVLPEGVDEASLERLVDRGLVEKNG
jgi:hypothetical protein